MKIFKSFKEWWQYLRNAAVSMVKGVIRLVVAVVYGVISLLAWLWRTSVAWVGRHPNVALGGFIVIAFVVWMLMFAKMRATRVGLEAQRDSIAWQFSHFKESHGYDE